MQDRLRTAPLFAALDDDAANALRSSMVDQRLTKGDVLFSEGEPGEKLYLIESGKITLTVTALSASKYRDLQKNHPPRDDDEFDQKIGYNEATFILPLLSEATVAARDHAGKDVPLDVEAWLDEDDGLDPVDTLRWFNTALGLQTGRTNRGPRLRVS